MGCDRVAKLVGPLLLFILIYLVGCSRVDTSSNFILEEAQVLCIYWSSSLPERDTLPAIIYKSRVIKGTQKDKSFFLKYSFDGSISEDLPLKKVFSSSSDNVVGLILESGSLYNFYSEDKSSESGCSEQDLMAIVESGMVYYRSKSGNVTVNKTEDFFLIVGPKIDF